MKHDYTHIDAAILHALAQAPLTFASFAYSGDVEKESKKLEVAHGDPRVRPAGRFVDARLQALRKAGKIRFVSQTTGWALEGGAT